ncbi:hypothetical protein GRI43_11270 [Altererythrobacter luteolus]|uniref:Uncharacterized protein n=1 Tax=Pontixanthobacter luteolus TaxID=295089 RepID=A0A6I4V2M2_9SPHN|nr:hypothetical protein [Pontixanthobacter luteolus]MXP47965.1 hypothetical protein [Pontixanthobacter luteolus]
MVKSAANASTRSTGGSGPQKARKWPWVLLFALLAAAAVLWFYRAPITGYAGAGTAYSARVACSCRFVGNRDLEDCRKDKLAGMEFVTLKEDAEEKSVTARFPLIASETAIYREGYGCVLRKWED